jgi:hypothetical protein
VGKEAIMADSSFAPMRDIGKEFGLSSHQLGRILTEAGFRDGGKPSAKAFQAGWVSQRFAPDGVNYMWAWSISKTRILLELKGYEPLNSEDGEAGLEVSR